MRYKSLLAIMGMLSGCATVEIKDHEFCGDLGSEGAACFTTLSNKSRDIPKAEWDNERVGMICERAEVFADWEAVILKLCHKSKSCRYQAEQKLKEFFNNVEAVHVKAIK